MISKTFTTSSQCQLDKLLQKELPELIACETGTKDQVSNSKIRRLIVAGSVKVNGKQCRIPSYTVFRSSRVEVTIDLDKFFFEKQPQDIQFELTEKDVLFEDDYFLVVNKPAFIPADETMVKGRKCMHDCAVEYLWKKNPSLRNPPYAGIMHRLDRETSGVLLFTKKREVNKAVHDIFENRDIKKTYRAVCTKNKKGSSVKNGISYNSDTSFSVKLFMGRISPKSQQCKMGILPEERGGQFSHTDFSIVAQKNDCVFVDCLLHSGRTHQIRLHLSTAGFPIMGDELYGGSRGFEDLNNRIMLHASSLQFIHPVTNETVCIKAPFPPHFE